MPENMPKPSMLLHQIIYSMLLVLLACTNTSLFVTFSVQLIFSILHHIHISNASNSFLLALVNVQVSAAYSATLQTVLFTIHFFGSQFNFTVNNFLVREQCLAHCNSCSYVLSSISII